MSGGPPAWLLKARAFGKERLYVVRGEINQLRRRTLTRFALLDPDMIMPYFVSAKSGNGATEHFGNAHTIYIVAVVHQLSERTVHLCKAQALFLSTHYHRMSGTRYSSTQQQFLMQLLSGPQTDVLNLHRMTVMAIVLHLIACKANHATRQINNLYWLAHIQYEDIAACALYLASPAAAYVTGEIYGVNGGLTKIQVEMPRAKL